MGRRRSAGQFLAALLLPAALSAQSTTVSVGPNATNNGTVTLYGSGGGSVALSVSSTGAGATSATLPYINGNVLVSTLASNFGDVVCSKALDLASTLKTGALGSVVITGGGSGYSSGEPVMFASPPSPGVAATGSINLGTGTAIGSITIINGGSNYGTTLPATFSVGTGGGSGATFTPQVCGNATNSGGNNEIAFTTTYPIPANLLVTSPHLKMTAGMQMWSTGTASTLIVRLYIGGGPGVGTLIYQSGTIAPAALGTTPSYGTQWTWDIFAPTPLAPATAGVVCSPSFPLFGGVPAAQLTNTVPQPVFGTSGINLTNPLTLVLSVEYTASAASGNALQLLWLDAQVN